MRLCVCPSAVVQLFLISISFVIHRLRCYCVSTSALTFSSCQLTAHAANVCRQKWAITSAVFVTLRPELICTSWNLSEMDLAPRPQHIDVPPLAPRLGQVVQSAWCNQCRSPDRTTHAT